jgi:hypothetical protein
MMQSESDRLRVKAVLPRRHLITGQVVESRDGRRMDVFSPLDGSSLATTADGGLHEIRACFRPNKSLHAFDGYTDCTMVWIAL